MNTIRLPFLHLLLAAALLALSLGASAENFTRRDVTFRSEGLNLSAWYYVPKGMKPDEKRPAIVMAHGFSAPKEALLANFADRFAAAGFVVTVFDFRFLGASEGEPRGQIFPLQQIDDYRNAITWTQLQKEVDPGRIGVWGTSYSGAHVLQLGAFDRRRTSAPSSPVTARSATPKAGSITCPSSGRRARRPRCRRRNRTTSSRRSSARARRAGRTA